MAEKSSFESGSRIKQGRSFYARRVANVPCARNSFSSQKFFALFYTMMVPVDRRRQLVIDKEKCLLSGERASKKFCNISPKQCAASSFWKTIKPQYRHAVMCSKHRRSSGISVTKAGTCSRLPRCVNYTLMFAPICVFFFVFFLILITVIMVEQFAFRQQFNVIINRQTLLISLRFRYQIRQISVVMVLVECIFLLYSSFRLRIQSLCY